MQILNDDVATFQSQCHLAGMAIVVLPNDWTLYDPWIGQRQIELLSNESSTEEQSRQHFPIAGQFAARI